MVEEALLLGGGSGLHVVLCVQASGMGGVGGKPGLYGVIGVLLHSGEPGGDAPELLMVDRLGCCLCFQDGGQAKN